MPLNATVTAKYGPGNQATAMTINGCTGVILLPDRKILQLLLGGDTNTPPMKDFDLTGVTTITMTITGNTYAITLS